MSTTVAQIVTSAQQDIMNQIGTNHPLLLDYTNRISLDMLRSTKWDFLLSDVQSFITITGNSNYWVGATGSAPAGCIDTGLNLTNLKFLKHGAVYDRSNFRNLGESTEMPVSAILSYTDGTPRLGRPAVYRNNVDTPFIVNIYPGPDNQNNQAPQPESPILTTTAGGALANRLYYMTTTFVDSFGNESTPPGSGVNTSPGSGTIFVPAGRLATVAAPDPIVTQNDAGVQYAQYNVYASSTSQIPQNMTRQNLSPISIPTPWTEPTSGLITTGVAPPTTNNCEPFNGYLIQFRYYETETLLTSFAQTLQIPDRYFDIVVAGVNWLSLKFLSRTQEAQDWQSTYHNGIVAMVRDRNQANRFSDYVSPDPTSLGGLLPTIETIDLSLLQP
jgi:hypothetical protein